MKKKLIAHAVDVAKNATTTRLKVNGCLPCQFWTDGHTFVTDGFRILEVEQLIDELPTSENQTVAESCLKYIKEVNSPYLEYVLDTEIPSVSEIKTGIRDLVGRRLDTVVWASPNNWKVNARWLYKAMEALNAKVVFVSSTKPWNSPIFLLENDDPQSMNREMILPVNANHEPGFYVPGQN